MRYCPVCRAMFMGALESCPRDKVPLLAMTPQATVIELRPGAMAGELKIVRVLGSGATGDVYHAEHPIIGKQVAIKVLQPHLCGDESRISRLTKDARALGRLRHRNIVEPQSFGQLPDGRHYFTMELLEGTTLERHTQKNGRLSRRDLIEIFSAVGRALDVVHLDGVAHGDIKPSNVFLAKGPAGGWEPKILDFGVSRLIAARDNDVNPLGDAHGFAMMAIDLLRFSGDFLQRAEDTLRLFFERDPDKRPRSLANAIAEVEFLYRSRDSDAAKVPSVRASVAPPATAPASPVPTARASVAPPRPSAPAAPPELAWLKAQIGPQISLVAAEIGPELEPRARVRALGEAAYARAFIEREIDQAKSIFVEACEVASKIGGSSLELSLAGGVIAWFDGQLEVSTALFEHALALATKDAHAWIARSFLTKLAIESGDMARVESGSAALEAAAQKLGEERATAFAAAAKALARLGADESAAAELKKALDVADPKDSPYLLHRAARIEIEHGRTDRARDWATVALSLAGRVGLTSDVIAAREILARVALAKKDREEAKAQVDAAKARLEKSGNARALVKKRLMDLAAEIERGPVPAVRPSPPPPAQQPISGVRTAPAARATPHPEPRPVARPAPPSQASSMNKTAPAGFDATILSFERPEWSQALEPAPRFASESEQVSRRLVAVMSADAEGYSRLMGQNDVAALRTLNSHRSRMRELVIEHSGRVVDFAGDSMLAEFPSTLEAFRCGLFIQDQLERDNATFAAEERMSFRIGIHVGDVVVEGNGIYGDGVNIAARLQVLATAGGLCISHAVHEQIRGRLSIPLTDLGEQKFKNILLPVRVFRVEPESVAKACAPRTIYEVQG
jgi:class 3 adenylate cyclase/tRNA A-37 threonylcarbamoyl transferase component Bud32